MTRLVQIDKVILNQHKTKCLKLAGLPLTKQKLITLISNFQGANCAHVGNQNEQFTAPCAIRMHGVSSKIPDLEAIDICLVKSVAAN